MTVSEMSEGQLHLIKLCVGVSDVRQLVEWQTTGVQTGRFAQPEHVTRMWPRRWQELVEGGSLYWVISGHVRIRQRIVAMEPRLVDGGIRKCALILSPDLVLTMPYPKRPFQGWRYLEAGDCPPDIGAVEVELTG